MEGGDRILLLKQKNIRGCSFIATKKETNDMKWTYGENG